MNARCVLMMIILFLSGCVHSSGPDKLSARLYDTQNGNVIPAWFYFSGTRVGEVGLVMPDGETMRGEYSTAPAGSTTWGSIYANAYSPVGLASSNAFGYARTVPNALRGQAVAVGNRGTTLQCEYVTNNSRVSSQGNGVCQDNRGKYYRLMFGG
jgi:hypothetical protein